MTSPPCCFEWINLKSAAFGITGDTFVDQKRFYFQLFDGINDERKQLSLSSYSQSRPIGALGATDGMQGSIKPGAAVTLEREGQRMRNRVRVYFMKRSGS